MKKYFITGLIFFLPIAITLTIVVTVINFATQPFIGFVTKFLEHASFYNKYRALLHFVVQIILLFGMFFFTIFLGFLTRLMIFKSVISLYDRILHRIPVIKTVYKAAQQVMTTIFSRESRSFKQVVLVPFPSKDVFCIGLVSGEAPLPHTPNDNDPLITIFIPTTPNPTSGFLTMYRKSQITFLDMKIEDAFKYVISCGILGSCTEASCEEEATLQTPPVI